jgi:hypothetical protein
VPDAIEVHGLREFRKALRDMESAAPRELNKALKTALEPVELVASSYTPRGDTGALQASNKVTTKGDKVVFRNAKPYANTLHWGRKTLRGVPSVVTKRPWFTGALYYQRDEIGRIMIREVEQFIDRLAP